MEGGPPITTRFSMFLFPSSHALGPLVLDWLKHPWAASLFDTLLNRSPCCYPKVWFHREHWDRLLTSPAPDVKLCATGCGVPFGQRQAAEAAPKHPVDSPLFGSKGGARPWHMHATRITVAGCNAASAQCRGPQNAKSRHGLEYLSMAQPRRRLHKGWHCEDATYKHQCLPAPVPIQLYLTSQISTVSLPTSAGAGEHQGNMSLAGSNFTARFLAPFRGDQRGLTYTTIKVRLVSILHFKVRVVSC